MFWYDTTFRSRVRLDGKTIVITGANTGLGKECARDLYGRGARVILACRDINKANVTVEELENASSSEFDNWQFVYENPGKLVVCKLDLCSLKSVRECAKTLIATETNIHILINNAGVFFCPFAKTEDGYETHFQTNYLGHFLLTLLLLPKIMESTPARIVNVSSTMHFGGDIHFDDLNSEQSYGRFKAYNQSKLANVLFTKELELRLREAKINDVNVYALHPGVIATEVGRHLDNGLFPGAEAGFKMLCAIFGKSKEYGAQTTLHCATSAEAENETGLYYRDAAPMTPSAKARDPEMARKLWDASLRMVGLEHEENLRKLLIAAAHDVTPSD